MRILFRVLSIVLVVTIPVTAFSLGANIVTRMPDVYQYEFKATDALKHFDINKNNDEMGEFISRFMFGKEKEFQLLIGDEEKPHQVFSKNEMQAAKSARTIMNVVAFLGIFATIMMTISFVTLKRYEFKKEIRKKFKLSVVIYISFLLLYLIGFFVISKMGYSMADMLKYAPNENDLLPEIITEGLQKRLYFSIAAVSTVIMSILGYAIYKLTAPKRIFSRN